VREGERHASISKKKRKYLKVKRRDFIYMEAGVWG